jgi:hypothetical protein
MLWPKKTERSTQNTTTLGLLDTPIMACATAKMMKK